MPQSNWKLDKFDTSELESGARQASISTARKVMERAKKRAPVVTGTLRDSARVVETSDGAQVVFDAPYAESIEKGGIQTDKDGASKFRAPRAFLANAMNESREDFEQEAAKVLSGLGVK